MRIGADMNNRIGRMRWVAILAVALAACGDDGSPTRPEDVDFAASLAIDLAQMTRLTSGVFIQTMTPGTGTAQVAASNQVVLDYTLWLPNGTLLQGPARLPAYPATGFIPGFNDGILGLKVGEVRRIVVPSALGYQDRPPEGSGIPKHSVLVFEVKLITLS
jgi:FKBP-type peptidyl-prolyl cis-trans isomerase